MQAAGRAYEAQSQYYKNKYLELKAKMGAEIEKKDCSSNVATPSKVYPSGQ